MPLSHTPNSCQKQHSVTFAPYEYMQKTKKYLQVHTTNAFCSTSLLSETKQFHQNIFESTKNAIKRFTKFSTRFTMDILNFLEAHRNVPRYLALCTNFYILSINRYMCRLVM